MTEFDKWWANNDFPSTKTEARELWDAAQRAALRTLHQPPYIPKPGDRVRLLSLCHPRIVDQVKTVIEVEKGVIDDVYWITTQGADGNYSMGLLGEVEKV